MARSVARQAAMQLLYERMSGGEADDESLDLVYEQLAMCGEQVGKAPSTEERAYIDDVLTGVKAHMEELDSLVECHSSGDWALSRVPHVDLSILRLSAYELCYRDDVPGNVSISEAMELADKYSEPKSGRYINGVLGAIERDKRKD
jgi:N utilization substance protein B